MRPVLLTLCGSIIGQRFHNDRHPAGAVTFISYLFEIIAVVLAGRFLIARSILSLGMFAAGTQRPQHEDVDCRPGPKARLGCHRYLADELGKKFGPLGVLRAFAIHYVLEL